MEVQRIMSIDVEVATPDMLVRAIVLKMRERQIGFVPVVENGEVVGAITDRDIITRLLPDLSEADQISAATIMSRPVHICYEDQTIEEVAAIMGENQVRRLPVLDRSGELVGVVSLGDIAENISELIAGEALGEIVENR